MYKRLWKIYIVHYFLLIKLLIVIGPVMSSSESNKFFDGTHWFCSTIEQNHGKTEWYYEEMKTIFFVMQILTLNKNLKYETTCKKI